MLAQRDGSGCRKRRRRVFQSESCVYFCCVVSVSLLVLSQTADMSASLTVQRLAALSGALAVTAGAYGAHGLRLSNRDDYQKELYSTANTYHFYHTLALLGAARCRKPALAGTVLLAGMGCFCGPLYHQALTGDPSFSKLAPVGGVLFIVGWLAMAL
ncbi:transmembrane protein 256 [Colossoma macropomum]|uniref:transmembrane protein 256 n=1 Tax=Colossoma macropomum TaxID=42526 RepID=UPI001863F600|nr:transmembrane protein 256 [Colossoma macropomum]